MSDDAVQSLVNDDVAKALDSLADIDPAQPSGAQPGFDPMSPVPDPVVGGMSIGSPPPPPPPPAPDPTPAAPISDVTGPGGLAMPAQSDSNDMPAAVSDDSQDNSVSDQDSAPASEGLAMPGSPVGVSITPPSEAHGDEESEQPAEEDDPQPEEPHDDDHSSDEGSNPDLERIREEAANELAPLISSVEDPHERFDVAMSVAQVSHDESGRTKMLDEALKAAKSIDDSKIKAEALAEILHNTHK